MANPGHLKMLKQGVQVWNKWRKQNPSIVPDLSEVGIPNAKLQRAHLAKTDFYGADITGADLRYADLRRSNLRNAFLEDANLFGADLRGADLSGAHLAWTDLSEANLSGVDLHGAFLFGASLLGTLLGQADFTNAIITLVKFGSNDLSTVRGLGAAVYEGPSTVGIDTVYLSKGDIPEAFLRGCGVPEDFILYLRSREWKAQYPSCFISYSCRNEQFAERLYVRLQSSGVRCWFAPKDLKIGDEFRTRIEESIRVHDKLLIVLSEDSINSEWVKTEVEAAFEKEERQTKLVLFPIRLDDAVMETDQAWAAKIRREKHIGDFRNWKDRDSFKKAFERLLRDLKASEK